MSWVQRRFVMSWGWPQSTQTHGSEYSNSTLKTGQLSEVNLDPDTLTDMVSIMVNKLVYKPCVKNIMDKYYEIFRDKNSVNKKDFFNSPNTRTRTRTQMGELDWGEVGGWMRRSELALCERNKSVMYYDYTVSHLSRLVTRYVWTWVCKWGPHKSLVISSMLSVSEVWKNKL